jgi:hypothetical protein
MTVGFKDGTTLTFPDGPQAEGFLQFDLPWLVYVHGKVTCLSKEDGSSNFAVEIARPKSKSGLCRPAA